MRAVKQKFRHRPDDGVWGDCHRAAIASILGIDADDVQHFGDGGPDGAEFNRRVNAWLLGRGLVQISVVYDGGADLGKVLQSVSSSNRGVYYLLGGRSKIGVDHTVVCLNDKIVWDPSLNDSGIVGPCEDGFYWITFLGSDVAMQRQPVGV